MLAPRHNVDGTIQVTLTVPEFMRLLGLTLRPVSLGIDSYLDHTGKPAGSVTIKMQGNASDH
jgi:hypothetical protein